MIDHAKELQDAADFIEAHPGGYDIHTSLLREAAAEIERLRAASQWKPIDDDTPRDGTEMLFCRRAPYSATGNMVIAFWHPNQNSPGWEAQNMGGRVIEETYSRWMPLPSPPTQEGGG